MRLVDIHESIGSHMPSNQCSHQFGECGVEVLRTVKKALASGFNRFIVVEGMVYLNGIENAVPHTWIEVGGEIKDPTVSQFKNIRIQYSPPGEYREEYQPEDYLESFEFQYGVSPSDI